MHGMASQSAEAQLFEHSRLSFFMPFFHTTQFREYFREGRSKRHFSLRPAKAVSQIRGGSLS